jgi:hypothetical protein
LVRPWDKPADVAVSASSGEALRAYAAELKQSIADIKAAEEVRRLRYYSRRKLRRHKRKHFLQTLARQKEREDDLERAAELQGAGVIIDDDVSEEDRAKQLKEHGKAISVNTDAAIEDGLKNVKRKARIQKELMLALFDQEQHSGSDDEAADKELKKAHREMLQKGKIRSK